MGPLLALGSALCYGMVDLGGGLLARRADAVRVAFIAQVGALVLTIAGLVVVPADAVAASDLLWGALSGVGTGTGMAFLYRGLARGEFSLVVPLVAVGGVVIPVAFGVAILRDRPSLLAWVGVALAIPALWLLLRPPSGAAPLGASDGVHEALLASVGIAVQYVALAQASADAALWPIVAGRVTAVATVAPLAARSAPAGWPTLRDATRATLLGGGAALALFLYLLATDHGMLTVTVVLASLYPVVPVIAGLARYGERFSGRKAMGLVAAIVAVGLLSTG